MNVTIGSSTGESMMRNPNYVKDREMWDFAKHADFLSQYWNAAPVLSAELPAQKLFIFLLWPLPHIKYGDALRTVGFVSACAEGQINDLLRHRAGRGQNAGGCVCRGLVHRGVAAHVE